MLCGEVCGPHESDHDDNSLTEYDVLGVYLILIDVTGYPKISAHVNKITWSRITEELSFVSCKSNVLALCIIKMLINLWLDSILGLLYERLTLHWFCCGCLSIHVHVTKLLFPKGL